MDVLDVDWWLPCKAANGGCWVRGKDFLVALNPTNPPPFLLIPSNLPTSYLPFYPDNVELTTVSAIHWNILFIYVSCLPNRDALPWTKTT